MSIQNLVIKKEESRVMDVILFHVVAYRKKSLDIN